MAVLPDGRLLLAGTFTEVNGVPRPGLARLSRDGTLDDEFEPNRDGGPPGWAPVIPASLAPLPGGDVLIGLRIPMYFGFDGSTVLRLSPSGRIDPTFSPALTSRCNFGWPGPFSVQGLVALRNEKILVMRVYDYSGCDIRESPLVLLNPDGTEDTEFSFRLPWPRYFPIMADVNSITQVVEAPDGALWAGGLRELVRLGPDGSIDFDHWARSRLSLVPRLRLGGYQLPEHGLVRTAVEDPPEVYAIVVKPNRNLLVAGSFLSCAGTPSFGLIEFYPDGTPRESLRLARSRRGGAEPFALEVTAPEGESFDLERSGDLLIWETVPTSKVLSSPMTLRDPQSAVGPHVFYRIRMHRP
jgi:hypothetical protein